MSAGQDALERFKKDAADHVMIIAHDDGLYRHLQFRNPDTSAYWFDVITAPGMLMFQGDGDAYVWRRVQDMFAFFRGPIGRINPWYWEEKLVANQAQATRYDEALLRARIDEDVTEAVASNPALSGLAAAVQAEIFCESGLGDESNDLRKVMEFRYWINDVDGVGRYEYSTGEPLWVPAAPPDFEFVDAWDWTVRDHHWWYLWACHAIVWGIAQYDVEKGTRTVDEVNRPVERTAPTVRPVATPIDATPSEAFL